ncbi:MAG: hypothetical protein GX139_12205 [Armatimonadetes bacterium]|nr:hypothetical protein [Armatimonadota bacterium]
MSKSYILPANALLVVVGLADLLSTLYWLKTGQAIEVNPVMAAVLQCGTGIFIAVKLATLGSFVGVMEWYRRHRNPAFARLVGSATLIGYLSIYAVSFCCVNYGTIL